MDAFSAALLTSAGKELRSFDTAPALTITEIHQNVSAKAFALPEPPRKTR